MKPEQAGAPTEIRLSYSEGTGIYKGTFWLDGSKPRIFIDGDIIHIGCKEITIEALDALYAEVHEIKTRRIIQ